MTEKTIAEQRQRHAQWVRDHPAENRWRQELAALNALLAGARIVSITATDESMFDGEPRDVRITVAIADGGKASLSLAIGSARVGERGERDWYSREAYECSAEAAYDSDLGIVAMTFDGGDAPAFDNAETAVVPAFDVAFFDHDDHDG